MFPTSSQELLLKSALLAREGALSAWQAWKEGNDLETDVDIGSYRLLPLVYKNLQALGVEDLWMGKLKGIYRLTWYKNQSLFRSAATIIEVFQQAQIKTLILKGAPLILNYYQDFGARPMNDFDILVPTDQRDKAIEMLFQLGWQPIQAHWKDLDRERKILRHAWGFVNPAGQSIDLHWHVFSLSLENDADLAFWDAATPISFANVITCTLEPTDMLLHVCVHGGQWDISSSIRWIPDAFYILTKAQSKINWDRLLEQAEKKRFVSPLRIALSYLNAQFNAPIPDEVLSIIGKIKTSKVDEKLFHTLSRKPTLLGNIPIYWYKYLRTLEDRNRELNLLTLIGFISYLQKVKGINNKLVLVRWAISRASLRIGRAIRGMDQAIS